VPVDRVKNVTEYKYPWWVNPLLAGFIILLLYVLIGWILKRGL
jgi:hypothetical protein